MTVTEKHITMKVTEKYTIEYIQLYSPFGSN